MVSSRIGLELLALIVQLVAWVPCSSSSKSKCGSIGAVTRVASNESSHMTFIKFSLVEGEMPLLLLVTNQPFLCAC